LIDVGEQRLDRTVIGGKDKLSALEQKLYALWIIDRRIKKRFS